MLFPVPRAGTATVSPPDGAHGRWVGQGHLFLFFFPAQTGRRFHDSMASPSTIVILLVGDKSGHWVASPLLDAEFGWSAEQALRACWCHPPLG